MRCAHQPPRYDELEARDVVGGDSAVIAAPADDAESVMTYHHATEPDELAVRRLHSRSPSVAGPGHHSVLTGATVNLFTGAILLVIGIATWSDRSAS